VAGRGNLSQCLAGIAAGIARWRVLRFSDRADARRANSANRSGATITAPMPDPRPVKALYRRQLLPTIFRVPSIIDPDLDERLDD